MFGTFCLFALFISTPITIEACCMSDFDLIYGVLLQLKLMATVHQTQPHIQLLLSTNEFVGALDLISTTQEVLEQELQGLVCFRYPAPVTGHLPKATWLPLAPCTCLKWHYCPPPTSHTMYISFLILLCIFVCSVRRSNDLISVAFSFCNCFVW